MRAMCRLALCGCLAATVAGCGNRPPPTLRPELSSLKTLGVVYGRYLNQHRGRPPASQEEFRRFLQQMPPGDRDRFKLADIDSLFVSPRDGKPLVVLYGRKIGPAGTAGLPWIAYEREPTDGRRFVVGAVGAVVEMDDQEFRDLFGAADVPAEHSKRRG